MSGRGHGLGECLSYIVSRSGKVLDSSGRVLQEIVPANVPDLTYARPLASFEGEPESFFNLAAVLLARTSTAPPATSRKRKFKQLSGCKPVEASRASQDEQKAFRVWEDDIGSSLDDIARAVLWRHKHNKRRRSSRKKHHADFENTGRYSDWHQRLVQHLKIGVSQMVILQRWQAGSRELPAKWASWLLKMLRKAKPPPQALQRFLFTVLVAILPVICCSLVCQTLSILPDSEVLRSVDILCDALEKSWSFFSPCEWEILEARMYQCQQVRLKAGTWLERRKGGTRTNLSVLNISTTGLDRHCYNRVASQSLSSSSDDYGISNDEHMSNELVLSEGVKSLVRRALRERQILNYKRSEVLFSDNNSQDGTTVSTLCPLSGTRLKIPARGIYCTHLTCFDLESYLEMNAEKASTKCSDLQNGMWRCPYCGSDATWPQIIVDGFILRILKSLPRDVPEVLIWPDGRWGAKEPSLQQVQSVEQQVKQVTTSDRDSNWSRKIKDSESSRKDTRASETQARNVKPRLAVSQTGETILGTRAAGELFNCGPQDEEGELSGNKASGLRVADVSKADEKRLCESTVDLSGKNSSVPVLHEIDLRGLIQRTLEKTKLNSCSWGRKGDAIRSEFLSVSWR